MEFQFNMSTSWQLAEVLERLKRQGVEAGIGRCSLDYPHVLVISNVEAAQIGLVRGWVLQVDPEVERVVPPTS
jgi:hypothetical protein